MINRWFRTFIFFFAIFFCTLSLYAQQQTGSYSFEFRGETLSVALEKVANKTGLDIVYDPKIVENIHVYKRIRNQKPAELLNKILAKSPLDFITLSSGTVVIIQAVKGAPAYGSYYGKVVDRKTREPLPGASVMLADASGGTNTGPSGSFALNNLVSGSYKIIFSYIGYKPVAKMIHIKPEKKIHDKITLKPKPLTFTPAVVTGYTPQIPDDSGNQNSISANSIWKTSRKIQDPIRSLSLFSGVQYGIPLTDLHLQGGQRGEHRILLDGVPIYNPYSFGRMFSAFSPYAIGKVTLYKAGYEVPEGSEIAGLINLSHDVDAVDATRFLVQGDPLSVNVRGNLYFPDQLPGDDSSLKIMVAARSNYWNIYKEPTLNHTLKKWDNLDPLITGMLINTNTDPSAYEPIKNQSNVRFYDVHFASKYKINSYNTLDASFYTGKNYVDTDLLRQAPPAQDLPKYFYGHDAYKWNNFMGQITYKKQLSPRFDLSSQLSFTSNRLNQEYLFGTNNNAMIPNLSVGYDAVYSNFKSEEAKNKIPEQQNKNRIEHYRIRTGGVYQFNPHFNFEVGLEADKVWSKVNLSDLFYLPTLSDQQSTFYSGYINAHWLMGTYWKFTLGNRLTYLNPSKKFYSEPRADIQYDHPGKGFGNWNIRLAGGLYRQFINQYEITNPGPTALVPSLTIWSHAGTRQKPKAWHLSSSFHLNPNQTTALRINAFYKWQPTAYTISYGNLVDGSAINRSSFNAFAERTSIKSSGAGIRLNQSFDESALQFMIGYDYSYNRIDKEAQFGRTLPPPWNQPHRFQLRTLWHIIPELTTVAKWQSIFGRSWGFRQAYYNYLLYKNTGNVGAFSFSSPENDRLQPFHELDLSFIYQPTLNFMNLKVRLDLINILDRHNTIDWTLKQNENEPGEPYRKIKRTMPGFNPSFSVEIDF